MRQSRRFAWVLCAWITAVPAAAQTQSPAPPAEPPSEPVRITTVVTVTAPAALDASNPQPTYGHCPRAPA